MRAYLRKPWPPARCLVPMAKRLGELPSTPNGMPTCADASWSAADQVSGSREQNLTGWTKSKASGKSCIGEQGSISASTASDASLKENPSRHLS